MSDFADYVQQQQAARKPASSNATANGQASAAPKQEHAELDILDTLDLADDKPKVRIKHLLLDESETKEDSISLLRAINDSRCDEGLGE